MSKSAGNTVMRFAAPGFSGSSTKTEKLIFNPGGVGTGDNVTDTGHKTWFGGGEAPAATASEDMLGTPAGPESFPTRPQVENRYRAGGISASDNEVERDRLGSPKKKGASRALLG